MVNRARRTSLLILLCFMALTIDKANAANKDLFILALPESVYTNNPVKRGKLCAAIWGTPESEAQKWDKGWWRWKHTPTGKIFYIYCVSHKQIKSSIPPSKLQQLKNILDDAGAKWLLHQADFTQAMKDNNMESANLGQSP